MTIRLKIVGLNEEIRKLNMTHAEFALLVGCDLMTIYRSSKRGVSVPMALAIACHFPDGVIVKSPDDQFPGEYRVLPAKPNEPMTWGDINCKINSIFQFLQEEIEGRAVS